MTAKGSRHAFGMAKARVRSVPTGVRMSALHYKTNSRITSRIIRLELVVRTIGLIVRTISAPWDPGG